MLRGQYISYEVLKFSSFSDFRGSPEYIAVASAVPTHIRWIFGREAKSNQHVRGRSSGRITWFVTGASYHKAWQMHTFPKAHDANIKNTTTIKMRWFLSFLLLGLFVAVNALSSSGNRLLVVLEELGEKEKYSKFLGDLEGEYS